jgi:hypothetical protein
MDVYFSLCFQYFVFLDKIFQARPGGFIFAVLKLHFFDSSDTEEGASFTDFLASERGYRRCSSSTRTSPSPAEDADIDQASPWLPSPFLAHQACAGKASHQNAGCASLCHCFPLWLPHRLLLRPLGR